eukprot:jgi/Psemu1/226789/e_gw1.1887.2.1
MAKSVRVVVPNPIGRCTCGAVSSGPTTKSTTRPESSHHPSHDHNHNDNNHNNNNNNNHNHNEDAKKSSSVWLESLWVHLLTPRQNNNSNSNSNRLGLRAPYEQDNHQQHLLSHGFAEQHRHLTKLLEAAYLCSDDETETHTQTQTETETNNNNNNFDIELCENCIDRVAAALDADTQRLCAEIEAYKETVRTARQRQKTLARHVAIAIPSNNGGSDDIVLLQTDVKRQSEHLADCKRRYHYETERANEFELLQEQLHLERNALRINSEAFDHRLAILTRTLSDVRVEVDKLACVALPRVVFELTVDSARGLHYPLINHLRLAFRPKGDLEEDEIRVAWALATQLLLGLGNLLDYPQQQQQQQRRRRSPSADRSGSDRCEWKLVPLADCAKLIYKKQIYDLEPGNCKSLTTWNALLNQIVKHALRLRCSLRIGGVGNNNSNNSNNSNSDSRPPPYESSQTVIGNTDLGRLDGNDHIGWSKVIHKMASNLLWLSNRASGLAAAQVQSTTHCVV